MPWAVLWGKVCIESLAAAFCVPTVLNEAPRDPSRLKAPDMNEQSDRKPKDRDFLRTQEGMFFCVTGYLHPPDRYTAYLKYTPVEEGKWKDGTSAYRRELPYYHVSRVGDTIDYLAERYPRYVNWCPVRGFRFSLVPLEGVSRYYRPEERLSAIWRGPDDRLEEQVYGLVNELVDHADLSRDAFGVTGSILIGIHNPAFSDIDLTVYGQENAQAVRNVLRQQTTPDIEHLGSETLARWTRRVAERFPLSREDADYLAGRRWNYGRYQGRYFSIHPTRTDAEIEETYGDHVYRALGAARIRAVISDASEALFMPAIYEVESVEVLEGDPRASQVRRIVSYEGLYRDVAGAGRLVEARGKLETVDGAPERLVIGAMGLGGRGYIIPVWKGAVGTVAGLSGRTIGPSTGPR